jgi:hypothetical protein
VAPGKGPPNTHQKIQICAELGFLGPNSEYACVNFFRIYILISLIPGDFLFQLTQAEKAEVVANCDHLQNLIARPKPGRRSIGFLTDEDKKIPKASTLTKGRKAP